MKYIDRMGNVTVEENDQDKFCVICIMTGAEDFASECWSAPGYLKWQAGC